MVQIGLAPKTLNHSVDEEALVAAASKDSPLEASDIVQMLARAKAIDACKQQRVTGLVLGGDSVFDIAGHIFGKPHTAARARERWELHRGASGRLYSGHSLLHCVDGEVVNEAQSVTSTKVTFVDDLDDAEIDAYVATGEPLSVAGAFTIDGRGAAFIESISGDPYTVVGVSVHALRTLVRELGFSFTDLWQ